MRSICNDPNSPARQVPWRRVSSVHRNGNRRPLGRTATCLIGLLTLTAGCTNVLDVAYSPVRQEMLNIIETPRDPGCPIGQECPRPENAPAAPSAP